MKVSLVLSESSSNPFPEQFVRLDEERDGERRLDVTSVAFAEEVDEGVEVRVHRGNEYVVEDARIQATYDM